MRRTHLSSCKGDVEEQKLERKNDAVNMFLFNSIVTVHGVGETSSLIQPVCFISIIALKVQVRCSGHTPQLCELSGQDSEIVGCVSC